MTRMPYVYGRVCFYWTLFYVYVAEDLHLFHFFCTTYICDEVTAVNEVNTNK